MRKITRIIAPGDRFGRGVVIEEIRISVPSKPAGCRGARLLCDCGNIYETLLGTLFSDSPTTSCGCARRDRMIARNRSPEGRANSAANGRSPANLARLAALKRSPEGRANSAATGRIVGNSPANLARLIAYNQSPEGRASSVAAGRITTHGLTQHPLYQTWTDMMRRCYNPARGDYGHYGGRGITVWQPWHDVTVFIADITQMLGPRTDGMTLDRFPDNDGNYEPGNVRWATRAQQRANQRQAS